MMISRRMVAVAVTTVLLAGCGSNFSDLDAFMAQEKAKPKGKIDPIPTFKPYEAFTYAAQSLRSPFEVPLSTKESARLGASRDVKPDLLRPREFLERFDIEQLSMVGTLAQKGTQWALLSDGAGGVHRVKVGNYIGKNHGRIVETTETSLSVMEIVPSGVGGWIERPRTIKLREN